MAVFAVCRESGRLVVGVIGRVVVVEVAADAIGGRTSIDAAGVAVGTIQRRVDTGELIGMIEFRVIPRVVRLVVAGVAGRRESRGAVIRIVRAVVVILVTGETVLWRSHVDSAAVARGAVESRVPAEQAVPMLEICPLPRSIGRAVARIALSRKTGCNVVGLSSAFVILAMAGIAVLGHGTVEASSGVAALAAHGQMLGADPNTRVRLMVPLRRDPTGRLMTVLACGTESSPVGVVLTADPVAVVTIRRCAFENAIPMTGCAGDGQVAAFERQQGRFVKCPRGIFKMGVHRVTCGAILTQRALVGVQVAGGAIGRQLEERSRGVTF